MEKFIKKISFLSFWLLTLFIAVSFAEDSAELGTPSGASSGTGSSFSTGVETGTSLTGTPDRWTRKYESPKSGAFGEDAEKTDASPASTTSSTPQAAVALDSISASADGRTASTSSSAGLTGKSEVPGRWKKKYDNEDTAQSQTGSTDTKNKIKPVRPGTQNIPLKNGQTVTGIILKNDKEDQEYLVDVGEGIKVSVRYDEIEWPKNADEQATEEQALAEAVD